MLKRTIPAVIAALLFVGCTRVIVPPKFDLTPREVVGIVEFKCTEPGKLGAAATHSFVRHATFDQIGIRIVELGDEEQALDAVSQPRLGPEAYQALGEKYGLTTLFIGEFAVSDVRPRISIGPGLAFASFSAEVEATLNARLVETSTGATIWSGSASHEKTVGSVSKFGDHFSFDAKDPQDAYRELVDPLVVAVTKDFRSTYYYRCCRR